MPNLHAHYYNGNVKAFRQELDGTVAANTSNPGGGKSSIGPGSASGGRSWTNGFAAASVKADPNERDSLGRTVLHLAATSNSQQSYSFFAILLRNPSLSVNLQDYESGYTALHRALYSGNIRGARDLLSRADIDPTVRDFEGLTAFDLYNGTVEGTNPPTGDVDGTDLYVWGVNRNYALGTGDSGDKAYPDRVGLLTQRQASDNPDPAQRFFNVGVKDVKMAKLHTTVVTNEARGNLSLCGFGSGGRLGYSIHSQLKLLPLPDLPHSVVSVALGQDHTLALTSGGYILSWGNNRFSQLGYQVEAPEKPSPFAKEGDELIQVSPKRIIGPLKKEWVRGIAAGRMSSAAWTADAVWTWGTNLGHLGYEKAANPVQVNPRKVTAITQPVIDVALSDYAMLCLLDSNEVLCFHHDTNFKINFATPPRSLKAPKNPSQVSLDSTITKVTSCGQTFATLSQRGDVCTFTLPHPSEESNKDIRDRHVTVKPQVQWALRKNFTAVRDMALGSDGTIIVCTVSGHVYVRQRLKAGSGQLKFRRIPYLQRIVKVATNELGAFAAVRVDAQPTSIRVVGKTLDEELFLMQPHMRRFYSQMNAEDFDRQVMAANRTTDVDDEEEEDTGSNSVARDTVVGLALCHIVERWQAKNDDSLFAWSEPLLGSDVNIVVGDFSIPAHRVLLANRSPGFARLFNGGKVEWLKYQDNTDGAVVDMTACHPFVAFLLLQYIYSDDVAAIWDSRVTMEIRAKFPTLDVPIADIKVDAMRIAEALELPPLVAVLQLGAKTRIATPTLAEDVVGFFNRTSAAPGPECDVMIKLKDREVSCQSVLLRARCPFFEEMFAERDWTLDRQHDGKVVVQMQHLRWRPMRLVFRYLHEGVEDDLFDYLHQETLDEFLDFVFEVLAAATELLLDRLVLVCSRVIARHCNPYNAAALSVEASFYQAATLKRSIFDYITACMETMLESGLLDDMDDDVLRDLTSVIGSKQRDKAIVPRTGILIDDLMDKHKAWLALQDIPVPRVRVPQRWKPKSPKLSPSDPITMTTTTVGKQKAPPSPLSTPDLKPILPTSAVEDMFSMDDIAPSSSPAPHAGSPFSRADTPQQRPVTPLTLPSSSASTGKPLVWKSRTVQSEKADLRSIMAETAATKVVQPSASARAPAARSSPVNGSPMLRPIASSSSTPWGAVETPRRTSLAGVQAQQSHQSGSSPRSTAPIARAPGSMASPAPKGGILITPVKQPVAPASTSRSGPQGAAWSTPTTYAAPPPMAPSAGSSSLRQSLSGNSPSATTHAFSLLAIQQQEVEAAARASQKPVMSLREIQAEEERAEREAREARAQEEEFNKWWAAEQARLKNAGGTSASGSGERGKGGGRGRPQKRVPKTGRAKEKEAKEPVSGEQGAPSSPSGPSEPSPRANGHGRGRGRRGGGGGTGSGAGDELKGRPSKDDGRKDSTRKDDGTNLDTQAGRTSPSDTHVNGQAKTGRGTRAGRGRGPKSGEGNRPKDAKDGNASNAGNASGGGNAGNAGKASSSRNAANAGNTVKPSNASKNAQVNA